MHCSKRWWKLSFSVCNYTVSAKYIILKNWQSERAPLGACQFDLDLWPFDPKIYRCLPFFILHLCMKYEVCRSNTFRVIALQRKCGQTDGRTDKVITIGLPHLRWRGPNEHLPLYINPCIEICSTVPECSVYEILCLMRFIQSQLFSL